jgi:AcrR family transcriptional regulator
MLGDRPNTYPSSVVATRRLGTETSETRAALLDATEQLMLDSGYAAVSSRRVAAVAGVRPALVHYYFRTMDDLFVEALRRRAEANLARFARAIAEDGSLGNLWRLNADFRGAAFSIEFVALANHRKAIRTEIVRYAERFRAVQIDAVRTALAQHDVGEDQLPPIVALLMMTGVAQVLAIEAAIGVTTGHDTTVEFIERAIAKLEAPPESAGLPGRRRRQLGTSPRGRGRGRSV